MKIKHFDAFAGIGGFTRAFKNIFGNDYKNVGFSEINKYAAACYQYHFPNHKNYGDITTIRPQDIGAIDIFTAGFPCQAFSIAGKRRGFEDARGTLFFEIARICKYLQPKYILLENVKGLLNHDGGRTISVIYQSLIDLGYTVEFQVVNTKWFLPQNRERIYLVGHLATNGGGFKPIFPVGENDELFRPQRKGRKIQAQVCSTISVSSAKMRAEDTYIKVPKVANCLTGGGHSGGLHSDMTVIQQLPRGKNKGNDFEICPTISSNTFEQNNFVSGIRRLTEIECERLQGFPDDWTKYGNYDGTIKEIAKTQRYKMLGNAVSVPVVEEIAKRLKMNN
ncbi:DNA (cytosine-5-)-methyltransferase [Capnocytophaga cynodegmi]|uniref:Cytosine-specific methyltransferase n=1 Tax=Capnocytophaga cynodegmi TaxID=28189 RepID=A0A286NTE8_9FLAO|nr:DNA (cytosine-5-)-methyltransferase [Capnocytophaga cynodegmi]ATA67283.1 DNA (cytosine-5-)-methyltransferase [Capnocytophaga cynodegmi]